VNPPHSNLLFVADVSFSSCSSSSGSSLDRCFVKISHQKSHNSLMMSHPQLLESATYALKFLTVAYVTWADEWADISLGDFSLGHHEMERSCCLVNDVMMVGGSATP
jgi:hypothetical protein